ncbi:CvpA family protein [Algibacter amylolyticus]|uniref:CvpA family protein n=1 Tax=Algibacter amylolyticus TaxID=1608400 RepID=A0A5M7BD57_9FLAO|nr:CvpA family protein [Algibacter amylolyticus]KAA5827586.1 CvpA family protein [Algibacter amylolyticus]MBB5266794.1 membrane protein required for colicin V production [Algibacter amylolyticus]TSJ81831.1 CvpA family protein [Algibacter amylolyticus]
MGVIDIVLGALILFGLVRGFMKGLFVEVASLIALVAGVYGAIHFSNFAAEFLQTKTAWEEKTINIVAFAITFIIIVLAIGLAGKALTKLADFAALGIINKLAGGIFGALKTALILSVILNVFDKMNNTITFVDEENIDSTILYKPVKGLVPMIFPNILTPKEDLEEDDTLEQKA